MKYSIHIIFICILLCFVPHKVFSLKYTNVLSNNEYHVTITDSFFSPGNIISDRAYFFDAKKTKTVKDTCVVEKLPKQPSIQLAETKPTFFSSPISSDISSMRFLIPVTGVITRRFAYRVHSRTRKKIYYHRGIDVSAVRGTPIKAVFDGTVVISCYNRRGYGHLIIVKHPNNIYSYYGHLYKRHVKLGQEIKKGEIIGTVGSTGRSTGPHLHFEIRVKDTPINPSLLIDFK